MNKDRGINRNKKLRLMVFFSAMALLLWLFVSYSGGAVIENPEPEIIIETKTIVVMVDLTDEVIETYTEEELYWLSRIVSAEARGESIEGQVAVANVVLNRVKSDYFPDSIEEVIFQSGQFCPVSSGSIYQDPVPSAVESAERALNGKRVLDKKVLFFYNPNTTSSSSWIRSRAVAQDIGNHRFAY